MDLLSRPEIQSAAAPFVVALLAYLGLRKVTTLAWIWAMLAGFAVAAGLINGLGFSPLTGTRKIILLVIGSFFTAALLPALLPRAVLQRVGIALVCLLALLWVFWTVAARMQPGAIALFLLGSIALVAWLQWRFDRIADSPADLHGCGLSLLLGVGLSVTAAASALLGQLTLALAAACGGAFLGWVLLGNAAGAQRPGQAITTLPYVLAPVLLGMAGVIFARLPWYALIPLALIPTARLPFKPDSRFLRALFASLPGLLIALAVAFWTWQSSASDSGY